MFNLNVMKRMNGNHAWHRPLTVKELTVGLRDKGGAPSLCYLITNEVERMRELNKTEKGASAYFTKVY